MGSGGTKAHEAFAVTPATTTVLEQPEDGSAELPAYIAEQLAQLQALAGMVHPQDGDTFGGQYKLLTSLTGQMLDAAQDLPEPAASQLVEQAKQATGHFLAALESWQLEMLAAHHGFDHPSLVGLNSHSSHPLAHWLDPAYPADLASKAKIQAKANERYQQLVAGETIDGLTLSEVQAAEAILGITPAPAPATWTASAPEVTTLMAELTDKASSLPSPYSDGYGAAAAGLLTAERQLRTADCAELGDSLAQLQASAATLVSKTVTNNGNAGRTIVAHLADAGVIDENVARWLAPGQAIDVARSTSPAEVAELVELAADRNAAIEQLTGYVGEGWTTAQHLTTSLADSAHDAAAVATWAKTTGKVAKLREEVANWGSEAVDHPAAATLTGNTWGQAAKQKTLSTAFRAWAKDQKLADLRAAASEAGLQHANKATRAQVQNYLAAQWDSHLDAAGIQATVTAKATGKTATPADKVVAKPAAATPTTGKAKTGAAPMPSVAARADAYLGTLGTLKAKLQAHQALASDLPAPVASSTVAAHDWGSGTPFSKGSHASTLHVGPDGGQWMFKPDKTKGGRAHAEAAASAVYQQVGIPGVRVHVTGVGKQVGSVQPLVKGAKPLAGGPSSWSQADVDAVVQLHVAAWAVGDHDAHDGNVMRSPGGAMFAVDQGQAFKFYGKDKLDGSWHPSTNHGTPVYQQLYSAHGKGTLGSGIQVRAKAALPVIKSFEALPDAQYRDMLRPAAVEGVKHGVTWVAPMRAAAQKRLGKPTVKDADVIDEFLHHAVERKQRLREEFAGLFASLGLEDADHLTWVK